MAAPLNVTTRRLSGKYLMNKVLSDSTEEILRLQGVSWFKRHAIAKFSLMLSVKHTTDEAGIEHVDIDQTLSGCFSSTEIRTLDWHEREFTDDLFGLVTEKSRRIPAEEITDEFLKKDWTQDTIENDIVLTDTWSTPGKNNYTWRALQTWGFAIVDGERRHVVYTTFTSPDKQDGPLHLRFVYDYLGSI